MFIDEVVIIDMILFIELCCWDKLMILLIVLLFVCVIYEVFEDGFVMSMFGGDV